VARRVIPGVGQCDIYRENGEVKLLPGDRGVEAGMVARSVGSGWSSNWAIARRSFAYGW
jgi:hypothetical protein